MDAEGYWQVVCLPQADPAELGLARQQTLADDLTGESARPALMLWRCQPALLVTRQETRLPRFREAAPQMQATGWPIVLRKSGGGACPVGLGTVQASMIEPALPGATMNGKYEILTSLIRSTLCFFRVTARTGPVPAAYCPGSYDLAAQGKKIAGVSQHWFRNRRGIHCVVTTASVNVEEAPDVLAAVVNRFYSGAGSSARCQAGALTSVRLCAGESVAAIPDLVSAVMSELGSIANRRGGTGEEPQRTPQPASTVSVSPNI